MPKPKPRRAVTDKELSDLDLRLYARALKKAKAQSGPVQFSYINWDNGYTAGWLAAKTAIRSQRKDRHAR